MPPWPAFLRSNSGANSSSSSGNPARNDGAPNGQGHQKPLPLTPSTPIEPSFDPPPPPPPTLIGRDGERNAAAPSPSSRNAGARPFTSAGDPNHHHRHNRSASHPLPKIFGRKKSTGNLADHHHHRHGADSPLDDVLDDSGGAGGGRGATPTRAISGKKTTRLEDEEGKSQRKCMCCASKVKVPKELDKFRCLACLCINDLKPVEQQQQQAQQQSQQQQAASNSSQGKGKRNGEAFPGGLPASAARVVPLSLDRTRAILERCVVAYLEERCRHEDAPQQPQRFAGPRSPLQTPEEKENPLGVPFERSRSQKEFAVPFTDAIVTSSPVDGAQAESTLSPASASIRDVGDFDEFAYLTVSTPPRELRPNPHGPIPSPGSGPAPGTVPSSSSITRKPAPRQPARKPPPPPMNLNERRPSQRLHPNGGGLMSNGEREPASRPLPTSRPSQQEIEQRKHYDRVKTIFRALEDYLVDCFGDFKSLNTSFSTVKPTTHIARARSESNIATPPPEPTAVTEASPSPVGLSQLDAKMLLLGDIGENSTWWTGKLNRNESSNAVRRKKVGEGSHKAVSSKSPNVNWTELGEWYDLIHSAGSGWQGAIDKVKVSAVDGTGGHSGGSCKESLSGPSNASEIEADLAQARDHLVRALLKVTENILKRPGRPLNEPEDLRWLMIILANPSLYPAKVRGHRLAQQSSSATASMHLPPTGSRNGSGIPHGSSPMGSKSSSSPPKKSSAARDEAHPHSGLVKRTFGLLASVNDTCHRYLIGWFSRLDEEPFTQLVDLVASFVTHRIARRNARPRSRSMAADGGLIPDLSGSAMSTSAQLHSAMGLSGSVKKRPDNPNEEPEYASDWQVKAAARVMSLLFAANNIWQGKRRDSGDISMRTDSTTITPQANARRSGQLLHTSSFYNTLLDYGDILADFKAWETKRDRFAFCQYPFFLSMGSKIKILEYDARRQMEIKAREAYFDSVIRQRALDGYFHLRVRRDCMVDDSLRQISEAVGSGPEELKKGLRVHFTGEEGVDAGGPRKEWFLMLVRDIFDPNHGLFVYDDDSHTCYFNPSSFETSDQYYLVGALLGLAIYNSTILDVALPPFAFRKLLAAAPALAPGSANVSSLTGTKGQMTYTLSDLAEFRPTLAAGLRQLLDFEGDVQETYCWNFVAPMERYGTVVETPLIPNGEATPVTNSNRQAFVEAYIRHLLDTAVSRQFEPFKRGFFQVCAGNALSLFRAEEIELLVRGSDEALDVDSLRAVAVYENWREVRAPHAAIPNPDSARAEGDGSGSGSSSSGAAVPVIAWFWEIFAAADPARQRRLLSFITGTDRIPAVGATSLILRIVAGGDGWGGGDVEERERFPVARTCFNMLVLWFYDGREVLERKLWRAVDESEGFGLK